MEKLLSKHFGPEWKTIENLQWYVPLIERNISTVEHHTGSNQDEDQCECLILNGNSDDDDNVVVVVV